LLGEAGPIHGDATPPVFSKQCFTMYARFISFSFEIYSLVIPNKELSKGYLGHVLGIFFTKLNEAHQPLVVRQYYEKLCK
jgi:hypothetical protein